MDEAVRLHESTIGEDEIAAVVEVMRSGNVTQGAKVREFEQAFEALYPGLCALGQGVAAPGTFMSRTLEDVPRDRRIELPVAEELQMGMALGLALGGAVPVSIYPRWNFLLLAANQLINHVDVMAASVIIRVGVGSVKPLYPGPQHIGDFSDPFRDMLRNTTVVKLLREDIIVSCYEYALAHDGPSVLVEYADLYDQ